ncbi:GntR family transcriptional regulator YhfZ [Pseudoleptotrichia goodfellowii]|uniref:Uncharacterized protein n=1 Tax=Pseudoleptotrichia goodfellowii TaxID=157692 RepID=A0A510JBR3_9FUSO|nr:GntR family transcriptional regulator YhfZ [Pseudoleptotrichia goodfellowii]BBM36759.1 hypothetical protein JCM16774_1704 [Pseudoleptotrichia goodfellowii]
MNNSEEKKLNKKNRSVLFVARELLFLKVGERIAPVTEYSEKYGISVGLIQRAFVLLQNEGAIKLDKRGVLGSFVKEINNEILLEKSDLGFLVGVMPLPYSKRYEGLATGIKNNFQNYNLNYYFAYMSGSGVRLSLLRKGIYDFAVVSRLAYEIERERNGDIESVFEFGANSYVSKHVLLKAPGVKKIVKIGVDRNSEDQEFLTKEFLGDSNYEFVEIDYNETLKLLENKIVDGIIWNYDEIEEKSIKMEYEELPESRILKKANEAVLVISRRNDNLRKLSRKIIDVDYIREIQQKVLTNQILPTY